MMGEVTQHAQVAAAISEFSHSSLREVCGFGTCIFLQLSNSPCPYHGALLVFSVSAFSTAEASAHRVRRSHYVWLAQATGRSTTLHLPVEKVGVPFIWMGMERKSPDPIPTAAMLL